MTEPASFLVTDADLPALRNIISNIGRMGYSETAVRERLGLDNLADLQWRALPIYREERLAERDPLTMAIDLFLLQGVLPREEVNRLFGACEQQVLLRTGLLAIDDFGGARARASLFPVGRRVFFSDHAWPELPHPGHRNVPSDQVMFLGADSRNLAHCTVRRPAQSALDLCTGSGVQALLAAAHSQRVLAVDINPRAGLCAQFNARISGLTNLEVVVGDLFEPVRGERFDLITANPPFVPPPLNTLLFRDGGSSGENVQKRIVAGLPVHLAPGGTAHMITELGERENEPLVNRLREWLNGAPIDIHVLRLREHSADKYAIGHANGDDYGTFLDSVREWARNLRAHRYARIVVALISFQWSNSSCVSPWDRVDESQSPQRAAGAELEAMFLAERIARKIDLPEILQRGRLRLAGPVALLDARLLGGEMRANAKATLLGQALSLEHQLDSLERELLEHVENPIDVRELLTIFRKSYISEGQIIAAITSLLRRRLVCLDAGKTEP